jgi:CHAT domain-containing protein/Tfp pilus assembly protein PilF
MRIAEIVSKLRFPDQILKNSVLLLLLVSISGGYSYAVQTAQRRAEVGRKALEEGDRLRLEGDEKSLRRALEEYEIARRSFPVIGEKEQYLTSLIKTGDVLASLSRYEESVRQYGRALKLTSNEHLKTELLNKLGAASSAFGKAEWALDYYRQALAISQKNSDRNAEARSLTNLGKLSYDRNDVKTALEVLNQSLTIWRSIGDVNAQAETLKYLGYAHTDLSELPIALEYHQQALGLCGQVHDLRCEAENTNAIGLIYALMGEREKAIENYSAAEKVFRSSGDRHGLITALNGRGAVYAAIGSERALDCHQEALRLSREIGDLQGQVVALRFLGTTYRSLADRGSAIQNEQTTEQSYNRAVECHTEALKLSHELKDRRIEAYILQELGSIYSSLNRKSEAKNFYQRALALSRTTSDRRGEALSLDSLGTIAASLKQKDQAVSYLRKALSLSQAAGDRARESATLFHLAHVNLDADQLPEARRLIEAGIEIVESLRTKVVSSDYRADYFASTRDYYELLLEILTRLNNKSPQADFAAETFRISEQARSRILLDSIKEAHLNLREGVAAELLNQEQKLGGELDAKAERIAQLKAAGKKDEATKLGDELRKLTTDYDEVRARIKAKNPRYASLTQPQVVTVSDVQRQLLDADTMVLEYLLSDERSYLWAITRNDGAVFELPGRRSIEQAARAFYELLTKNQLVPGETFDQQQARIVAAQAQLPAAAAALSDIVLQPVADKLSKKRLLIVADGALQYVPFQALMIPGKSGGDFQPLLLNHEVINEPSASVLALMVGNTAQRRVAPYSVMVYADPVFEARDSRVKVRTAAPPADQNKQLQQAFRDIGFEDGSPIPPLPGSREEAEAIISMAPWRSGYQALNFDANRASVNDTDLSQYRVIHFATHGFVDYQHPELSGLVLSMVDEKGNPQDGFLRMHDIYNLKLPVDLVVLSACNTGLGKEVKGEGLIGLTRGFMYAGARGVVASLWKVDDDATAELMKQFYAGMFQKGLTPAAALREAQLALRSHKRWESPYYWAAFVMQGEYDQKPLVDAKVNVKVVVFGAAILLLGAVFVFLWRRRRQPIK